ncbi:TBC domain-containing protein [Toxoplasma gondii ME49]|uniref:TBC domain-containing protein n=2 Tax=Toxoplasma gondii TaxID=5811 RepID=A0A125YTC5_TOXGV|nr:TBC domain-containing protein [Toxoplasma gondii ME49]EPT30748.1 TBC domain-containing protein [Toxoplasma gondii ME49]ESS31339.1 TBC domain-containing protein [Toxoplasma gondii VEG]CEL73349.1 TPA: TBC domain-containing protein [Toxoplasma gondii VEG]|eukprot:XP_018637642.1 TBC domain-containing protein [Toxoplasma gondii ME49]
MVRWETSVPDSGPEKRYVSVQSTVLQPTQQEHFRRIITPEYGRSISGSPVDPSTDVTSLDHNQSVSFAVIKPSPKFFLQGAGIIPTTPTYILQKKNSTCGQIVGDITEKALVTKPDKFRSSYCASSRSSHGSIDPSSPPHKDAENIATGTVQATIGVSSVQPSSCQTATVLPVSSSSSNNPATFEDRDLVAVDRIRLPVHENRPSLPCTSSVSPPPSSFPSGKAQSIPEPSPPDLATVLYMSSLRAKGEEAQKTCGQGEIKTKAGRMEGGANSPISISPAAKDARITVPETSQASDLFPLQTSGVDAKKEGHRKPMCQEKDGAHLSLETAHRLESVCFVPNMKTEVDSKARSDDTKQRRNKIMSDALHRGPSGIQPVTSTASGRVHCRDLYNRLNSMLSEGFNSVPSDASHVNPPVMSTKETEAERSSSSSEPTSICVEGSGSSPSTPALPEESGTKCSEISSCPQAHQDAAVTGKENVRVPSAVVPEQIENWEARRNFCWANFDAFRPRPFRERTDGDASEGNKLVGLEAGSMSAAIQGPNGRRSFALEKHPTMPACVSGTSRKSASPAPIGVKAEPKGTVIPRPPLETTARIASSTRGTSQGANSCHFGTSLGACQAKNCEKCDFENGGTTDQSAVGCRQRAACEYKVQQEQRKTPSTEGSDRTILSLSPQSRTEYDASKLSTLNIPAPIQGCRPFDSLEDHSCPKLPVTRPCPSLSEIGDRLASPRVQLSHEAHLTGTTNLSGEVVSHVHHFPSRKHGHRPQHGTVVRQVPVAPLLRTNMVSLPLYQDPPTLMECTQVMSREVEQQHQVLEAKRNKCLGRKEAQHEQTPAHVKMTHVQATPACRPKSSNQCVSEELGDILLDHQHQGTPELLPGGVEEKTRSCCAAQQCASRGLDQVRAGCEMRSTSLGDTNGVEEVGIPTSATPELTVHIPARPQGTATLGSLHEDVKHSAAAQLEVKDASSPSLMSAVSNLGGHSVSRPETAVGNVKEEKYSYSVPEPPAPLLPAPMPHDPSMPDISADSPATAGVCVSVLRTSSHSIPEQKPSPKSLASPSAELPLACFSECAASVPAQRDLGSAPCDSSLLKEVSRLRSSGKTPDIALQKHAACGAAQRQVCEAPREVEPHVSCMSSPHDTERRCRPGTSLSDWLSRLPISEEDVEWITSNVDDFIRRKNSRQHAVPLPSDTPASPRCTTEAFPDSGEDRQERCGLIAEDLDLHLVEADVSRQRWINHGSVAHSERQESERQKDMVQLVTDAVCIFCTMHGACYWQGMHDLCAAFLFLSPRPSLSQLVQLLHAFLLLFAPWLLLPPQESIVQSANAARLFRQFLQFFSPGVTNEVERLIPSITWSQSILIHTLGFSRFRDVQSLLSMWRCLLELRAPEDYAPSGYFFFLLAYFELHKEELRIFPELIINSDVPFDHSSFSQTRCPACHGADTSSLIDMPARGDESFTSLVWQRPFPLRHILHCMLKLYSLTPPAALLDLQSLLATCSSLAQSSVQRRRILRAYPWSTSPLLLERPRGNRIVCSAAQFAQPTGDSKRALPIEPEAGVGRDENIARTTSRLSSLQSSLCLSLNPGDLLAELRNPLVFQRPSFLNSGLSEWLAAPMSCELQSLRDEHCFEELLSRIRGKMNVISPYQASTCLSLLATMSPQESPSRLNDSPSRFACDKNGTSPLKPRDITVVGPSSQEAPGSQQAHLDGPTDTTTGGTVVTFASGQRTKDIWTSELIEVHFVDLRSTEARQRGPTLEKLLGLKPGRLPGGAKYRVVSVATSSSFQEATCSRDCGNSVVDSPGGRESLAVRTSRVTRSIEGESRPETRSTSTRSRRPPRDSLVRGMHTMRRHRGRAPLVTGGACHAREQSAIASGKTRQSTYEGERTTQSQLLSPRNVLVAGRGAWLMRRRSKQGISRKGASGKLATDEDLARTDRSGVQARDGEAPNKNCLSLDELIDNIRSMNNNAPNVMRIWLLIPHADSVNESLLEEGLLHPEASRSEMSALQEAYFRLTCAGIEGVLALNGGFAALERAMELAVASNRYTSMDVACVNLSTPSVSISDSAGPSGASDLSPQHLTDNVGNGTPAGRHQARRSAEKLEVSAQTKSQGEDLFLVLPRIQRLQRRRRKIRSYATQPQARVDADTCLPNTPTSALRGVGQAIATWLFPTRDASGTVGNHESQGETYLQVSGERHSLQATGIIKVMASSQKRKVHENMPPSNSSSVFWSNGETSCTGNTSSKQSRTVRKATHVPEETSPNFPRAAGSGHPVALSLRRPHSQPLAKISVDKCVDVASRTTFPASTCSGLGRPLNRLVSPIQLGDQGLVQMQKVVLSGSFSRVTHSGSLLAGSRQMTAVPANIVSTRKALCRPGLDSVASGMGSP